MYSENLIMNNELAEWQERQAQHVDEASDWFECSCGFRGYISDCGKAAKFRTFNCCNCETELTY